MTDSVKLNHRMLSARMTKRQLANILNISEACFYNKLNNKREFKASEICKIKKALNLSPKDTVAIFLQ